MRQTLKQDAHKQLAGKTSLRVTGKDVEVSYRRRLIRWATSIHSMNTESMAAVYGVTAVKLGGWSIKNVINSLQILR